MKNKIAIGIFTVLLLLSLTNVGISQTELPQEVGVSVGDTFNYKITDDTLFSDTSLLTLVPYEDLISEYTNYTLSDLEEKSGISFSQEELTAELEKIPSTGDIVSVEVVELPSNSANGTISVTHGEETKELETWFMFGSPVTTTNWTFWESVLDKVSMLDDNFTEFTLLPQVTQTNDVFDFSLTLFVSPTLDMDYGGASATFKNIEVSLEVSYAKDTGVQQSMSLELSGTISSPSLPSDVAQSQIYSWELTDDTENTESTDDDSTGDIQNTPGFEFLVFLTGLTVLTAVYSGKRRN